MPSLDLSSDAELVAASLAGDRAAFGQIVERYQRMLCSVAYSATGQLSQSEDLAQEAFIEAWRNLADLREPEKLRAWLCGILRFKISRLRRSDHREPVRRADELDAAEDVVSTDVPVGDLAAQREEQAILWSALERVPEIYREPLVLYYREHQSVEHVAAALDLSEDAVKQRLARGRKILQEQVLAFVQGALVRSTPGKLFTVAVLAALPSLAQPAKAATIGVAVAKGSALAKAGSFATLLGSFSGMVGAVLTLRASLDQRRTPRERRAVSVVTSLMVVFAVGILGVLFGLRFLAGQDQENWKRWAVVAQGAVVITVVAWPLVLIRSLRGMQRLRASERREHPECFADATPVRSEALSNYKSRAKLFGVPLLHIRFGAAEEGEPPVIAWFAGGDRVIGLLVGWGGLVIAPISVGTISVGLVSLGSVSFGLISVGTLALGFFAVGCASMGYDAFAWLTAWGWKLAAGGGFAIAHTAAAGAFPSAAHTNDAFTHALLTNWFHDTHPGLFFGIISVLSVVPIAFYSAAVRKRYRQN